MGTKKTHNPKKLEKNWCGQGPKNGIWEPGKGFYSKPSTRLTPRVQSSGAYSARVPAPVVQRASRGRTNRWDKVPNARRGEHFCAKPWSKQRNTDVLRRASIPSIRKARRAYTARHLFLRLCDRINFRGLVPRCTEAKFCKTE